MVLFVVSLKQVQGKLLKQNPKGAFGKKAWKQRFFKLEATKLKYFQDENSSKILGEIFRERISAVGKVDPINGKPTFQVVTSDRTYLLSADNEVCWLLG